MKIKFIIFLFFSIWIALLVRIYSLSVESNAYYKRLSYNNTIKKEKIAPVRSEIVDRKNRPIAINKLGFKIQLKPHLRSKKNIKVFNKEIETLKKLLPKLDTKKIIKNYTKRDSYYNHNYIDVVHFVSYEDIMPIYSILNLRDNVHIIPSPKRFYPYKEIASHVIGYVSRANKKDVKRDKSLELIGFTGKTGVERYYSTYLQGNIGEREIKVNANNQEIKEISYKKANEDKKLMLNIDIELQKYISSMFDKKAGAVIVMGVNGDILSASSYPEYNLNTFVSGISHKMWNKLSNSLDKPFINKLTHGLYPPGSSIKTGLGLIYITTNVNPSKKIDCISSLPLGNRIFRCWRKKGHRHTDITKAIRESCDDYFYKGSLQVGIKTMSEGLMRYGLGKKTGIDLPNEFIGTVPSRVWKRKKYNQPWYVGETVNTSIGQGDFLVTPMQMAQYTALMATGKLPKPYIASIVDSKHIKPKLSDVLNAKEKKNLPIIQNAMYEVCNAPHGTAVKFLSSKIAIAGKTGTAQVVTILQNIKVRELEHEMDYYSRSHAWFTTYGPYKNPQYVVLVLVEHGGHGGKAAGQMISNIYNKLLELGYIKK
jgi:penicillin-binding protein 2